MRVLAIESSCDETAAAVVTDEGVILSDIVRSQIALHAPYGGIVPEIAARDHIRAIVPVVNGALDQAQLTLGAVDGVAVTNRPGLVGALLVGVQVAKGLAWGAGKPLVGVDHLVAHLLSVFLSPSDDGPTAPSPAEPRTGPPRFPFIGLLVSGGHTALYRCSGSDRRQIEELGATRDDAVGEAFDKVAKLLGLGYPGGPIIDGLAAQGDWSRARVELPTPMGRGDSPEFSFSGLKSAVARHVASADRPRTPQDLADLCAAFQRVVTRVLVNKAVRTAQRHDLDQIVLAGGVAANGELRRRLIAACQRTGIELHVPRLAHCTDNAAMVGYVGALKLAAGGHDELSLSPSNRTELPRVTRKGRGKRARRH
jgi:N6-L-threonylcarbamoyladenine synthase